MSKMKLPETVIAVSILSGIVKQCPIYITYTNVNGYLIPNFTYKSGEQMEQLTNTERLRKSVKGWNRNMVRDLIKHQFQE